MTTPVYPNAISFADLKTEFGASNSSSISLGDYYAGGSLIPSGTSNNPHGSSSTIPGSGVLSLDTFHGTTHPGYRFTGGTTYTIPYGITKLSIQYWDLSGTDLVLSTATPSCTPGGTVTVSLNSDASQASTLSISGYGTLSLPVLRKPICRINGNVDAEFSWNISLHASGGNTSTSGTQSTMAAAVAAVGGSMSFVIENAHGQLGHNLYYYPVNSSYIDTFSSVIGDAGFPTFLDAYAYRNGTYPPFVSQTPSKSNGYQLGCWERDEVADEGYCDVRFGVFLPNYILGLTPLAS
jgi:hypothetical protein